MKQTKLALLACMAIALASCSSDENNGNSKVNPTDALSVKEMVADFGVGQLSVSTANYKYAAGTTANAPRRVLGDYEGCASFASKAAAVAIPEAYLDATEPTVPADAEDLKGHGQYSSTGFVAGKSYYVSADVNYSSDGDHGTPSGSDELTTIYIKSGANVSLGESGDNYIKANYTNIKVVILPGATVTVNTTAYKIENWGKLIIPNGYSQIREGGWGYKADTELLNYGELESAGQIQIVGTFYSNKSVEAQFEGTAGGKVYVNGDLTIQQSFGHSGELYVAGALKTEGNVVNINNGLSAHVGSVEAPSAQVVVTAASQLMVEGDVTAASLKLDGANENTGVPSECVIKGEAKISGNVDVASGTKGYIELLECENYTANASDIWVGCKSIARDKFELNGNAKFTMADGVYVEAGRAVFASNSYMNMMSNAFFNVANGIELKDVGDVVFTGLGKNTAIVKCKTLAANYEDFAQTFVGNIGVDFEAWDYYGSTGLIDQNKNLPTLKEAAAAASIAVSECNPGYNPKEDPDDPTPPTPPTPTTCDLAVDVPIDIDGSWIIQADDFAIHNGDKLYESFAKTDHTAGSELNSEYVVVTPGDNVVVTLTDICDMYEEYKNATNAQGVPYVSEDGILTVETYLWPAKKHFDEEKGVDVIEPIDPEEFGCYPDGKYLIGTAEQPAFYVANEKYNVYVSAFAGYNGGGNDAAMTTYVKVSFHISPVAAAAE